MMQCAAGRTRVAMPVAAGQRSAGCRLRNDSTESLSRSMARHRCTCMSMRVCCVCDAARRMQTKVHTAESGRGPNHLRLSSYVVHRHQARERRDGRVCREPWRRGAVSINSRHVRSGRVGVLWVWTGCMASGRIRLQYIIFWALGVHRCRWSAVTQPRPEPARQ